MHVHVRTCMPLLRITLCSCHIPIQNLACTCNMHVTCMLHVTCIRFSYRDTMSFSQLYWYSYVLLSHCMSLLHSEFTVFPHGVYTLNDHDRLALFPAG